MCLRMSRCHQQDSCGWHSTCLGLGFKSMQLLRAFLLQLATIIVQHPETSNFDTLMDDC